jgi:hypothetical protein
MPKMMTLLSDDTTLEPECATLVSDNAKPESANLMPDKAILLPDSTTSVLDLASFYLKVTTMQYIDRQETSNFEQTIV